jgi:uncharacterized protein YbjT (DUF2867 family)
VTAEPTLFPDRTIFLTGATGYIGGRLAPRLLQRGFHVRCLARSAAKLRGRPWAGGERVEVIEADATDLSKLTEGMRGCEAAYFLIHSMETVGNDYHERDLQIARTFGKAAAAAGVPRIIYLGGLGDSKDALSEHLASRRAVETALGDAGVPVTVLRAAMIIGSGSASFEILRYLVERLPVMTTPRWVRTESQPISIRDVLYYLIAALETPETTGRAIEIGGPDVWNYEQIMREMARALGLKPRVIIPVPVLTPKLSALWIHLITPLSASIAQPLAEGLRNRMVVSNDDAQRLMPHRCLTIVEAMAASVLKVQTGTAETAWSDAGPVPGDPDWSGGTFFVERRATTTTASTESLWQSITAIGGDRGYYAANWLWHLRGILDRIFGGPGLRRGRRNPTELRLGDALDFWRVMRIDTNEKLVLTAEMLLPGIATLTLEIEPGESAQKRRVVLTAHFRPRGLFGISYWYSVAPLHRIVFRGMLNGIVREAMAREVALGTAVPASHGT